MGEVHFVEVCAAPVDVAFAYLDDYRNVLDYWHGMTSYTPVGDRDQGLGAVFAAVTKVGPTTLKTTLKTVEWERNKRVAYKSVSGMDTETTFAFTPLDTASCQVEMRVTFRLPGGFAGRALERTLEPFVASSAKATAQNMSREIARFHAAQRAE